jgi:integrase
VYWLDEVKQPVLRTNSYRTYAVFVHKMLIPALGKKRLDKLTVEDVQKLLNAQTRQGVPPITVRYLRNVLKQALAYAQARGKVVQNVASMTTAPAGKSPERPLLSMEQLHGLLQAAAGTVFEPIYWMALQLGMRQGEILALRWRDVNLADGVLHVRSTLAGMKKGRPILTEPKTESSKRMVPIPESLRTMLRSYLARQSEVRLRNGRTWIDNDLVFCLDNGEPISGNRVRKSFRQFAKAAGIPEETHFHDLRHACATVLAEQGVPPRVAMEILGHRDMRTAELVYKHAREASLHDAIRSVDMVFSQLRETA